MRGPGKPINCQPIMSALPPCMGSQNIPSMVLVRKREKNGVFFHLRAAAEQDARLRQMENTPFFSLLRTNTIEGMFCDPMHGGNADMIGWQLIGFPGPRMGYFEDVDQHY